MKGLFALVTFVALMLSFAASSAFAQGTYVSAALTGDIVRFTRTETQGGPDSSGSGEAIGFALRVGTPLGSRFGVEAEFHRSGEIETERTPDVIPYQTQSVYTVTLPGGTTPASIESLIYPPFYSYSVQTRQRFSTFSAAAWARQDVSARVAMLYLAGLGFYRDETETELTFNPVVPLPLGPLLPNVGRPIILPPSVTRTIAYGARPFAGIEARINMTEHVELVPGVRLHGLDNAWLVRPSVGLGWSF